jgi:hypothetical protein
VAVGQQPGRRPLDRPAVAPQPRVGLDPTPRDPGRDPSTAQRPRATRVVVAHIAVQFGRSLARPPGRPAGPMIAGTACGVVGHGERGWKVRARPVAYSQAVKAVPPAAACFRAPLVPPVSGRSRAGTVGTGPVTGLLLTGEHRWRRTAWSPPYLRPPRRVPWRWTPARNASTLPRARQ